MATAAVFEALPVESFQKIKQRFDRRQAGGMRLLFDMKTGTLSDAQRKTGQNMKVSAELQHLSREGPCSIQRDDQVRPDFHLKGTDSRARDLQGTGAGIQEHRAVVRGFQDSVDFGVLGKIDPRNDLGVGKAEVGQAAGPGLLFSRFLGMHEQEETGPRRKRVDIGAQTVGTGAAAAITHRPRLRILPGRAPLFFCGGFSGETAIEPSLFFHLIHDRSGFHFLVSRECEAPGRGFWNRSRIEPLSIIAEIHISGEGTATGRRKMRLMWITRTLNQAKKEDVYNIRVRVRGMGSVPRDVESSRGRIYFFGGE